MKQAWHGNTDIYKCGALIDPVVLDLENGIFTVEPEYILGDLNGSGRVESVDATICLDIAAKKVEPSEIQKIVGDVSGDSYIRSNDCSLIISMAAGHKLEDLKPGYSEKKRMSSLRSSLINISIPGDLTVSAGDSLWVPVEIDKNASEIMGSDIVLNYDPSLITATNVRTTSMTENFEMGFNVSQDGQIRISFTAEGIDKLPEEEAGTLVEVEFTAKAVASESASPLTLAVVRLNDAYSRDFATSALQVDVNTSSGSLTVTPLPGNIDHSETVDLRDALLALKVTAGMSPGVAIFKDADVNDDEKIGIEEVIYILRLVAGVN